MKPVDKIRYAFERDMIHRMPRKHDIIKLCLQCGADITGSYVTRYFCKMCSTQRRRDQVRRDVRKHRASKMEPEYVFTIVDKNNLKDALIRACVQDMLKKYATPINQGEHFPAKRWLVEFAEPYMAAIGEHINIDRILEKIDERN